MAIQSNLIALPQRPLSTGDAGRDVSALFAYLGQLESSLKAFADKAFQNDQYQDNLSGNGQLFDTSNTGFQWIPKVRGNPNVFPIPIDGYAPLAFDPDTERLYVYSSELGKWVYFCACGDYVPAQLDEGSWLMSRPRLPYFPADEALHWMYNGSGIKSSLPEVTGIDGGIYWMLFEGGSFPLIDQDEALFWMTN